MKKVKKAMLVLVITVFVALCAFSASANGPCGCVTESNKAQTYTYSNKIFGCDTTGSTATRTSSRTLKTNYTVSSATTVGYASSSVFNMSGSRIQYKMQPMSNPGGGSRTVTATTASWSSTTTLSKTFHMTDTEGSFCGNYHTFTCKYIY